MKTCDNTSVGILIQRANGDCLMFDRATFPAGVAPAAGHIDDHGTATDAAFAEVEEELGLTVTCMTSGLLSAWRGNRCRRAPGPKGVGHQWDLFTAEVRGELNPSARETRNVRWITKTGLQALTNRTAAYAAGEVGEVEFAASPGIEPVWVQWLVAAGLVSATAEDLALIDKLAAQLQP